MVGCVVRMLASGAAGHALLTTAFACALLASPRVATAQLGPVDVSGFLEYQYRQTLGSGLMNSSSQLGTFRTDASTYLWRPWIMQLNGTLGLTKTVTRNTTATSNGNLITGGLRVDLLRQSRFPFAAFVDSRDSRVEGDLQDLDILTRTYGFMQQFAASRGGRYSLDYRHRTIDDLFEDSSRPSRKSVNDIWQAMAQKTLGRNQFTLNSNLTDTSRDEPQQTLNRMRHTLRHRFRSDNGFFLEDTTFFSNERFGAGGFESQRQFMQFNGASTWRPRSDKPLLIVARGLLQGTNTASNGFEQGSKNASLTGSANYQYSERTVFAANAGISAADTDSGDDTTSTFQRVRADYRSRMFDLWSSEYRWGGSVDVGNTSGRDDADMRSSVQGLLLTFNHHLSKWYQLGSGRNLEFNLSQVLTDAVDTDGQNRRSATHTLYSTLSRQEGKTNSYIRLSATDRRMTGDFRDTFQLLNLQASRSTQTTRYRAWSGSLTLQYGHTVRQNGPESIDDRTTSYSANVSYRHANLFDVSHLNFTSQLHLLSSDFMSDEPFEENFDTDRSRTDTAFRNRLDYRIGLLQLRLEANAREINSVWNSMIFLSVRRYYGIR